MSATVDERIVAAKFDASDFEKGVDKTIKKLDELKKSLDMKGTSKSVEELAEKAKTSTESMNSSLEKLTNRLTTFTGMIKQQILSGLAEEFSSVFLKMERAVTSFIRAISTDQIGVGLDKYQQILTSVRVMSASGIVESKAYESIGDLRDYVDQTSYSLTQMTDALSKMVSAGVNVDVATKSVQGIANACANAGINAYDAQRAFYNLAQAYGKGKLEFSDYRSLELLNMTTATFKNQILEAAVEAQKLKKINDDTYKIISGKGKGKKVNSKNLTDMMKYGFITNDVMDKLFGDKYYFSEKEMDKIRQELGIKKYGDISENDRERLVKEAKKQYGDLAVESYLAAKEARSFTDVINTLKDVVSTGWSNTFEIMFGKLEQAKDFFTALTEGEFANAIYSIAVYRNKLLSLFGGQMADGKNFGAEMFTKSILNISDALGILFRTILQILPGYDELEEDNATIWKDMGRNFEHTALKIRDTTKKIKETAGEFNKTMNSPIFEEGPTRIEIIRNVFSNLLSIFTIAKNVIATVFTSITKVLTTLSPILDSIILALDNVTKPLSDLAGKDKPFKDITNSVDNLNTVLAKIVPIVQKIVEVLGVVGNFLLGMALDTVTMNIQFFSDALGFLFEVLRIDSAQAKNGVGVIEGIKNEFNGIVSVCSEGLTTVKTFLDSLLGDLRELFGLTEKTEGKEVKPGGAFSRLTEFFNSNEFVKKAKAWIDQAIVDIGDFIKDIPNKVKAFGENVYSTIWKLFFYEKREDVGGEMKTNVYKTELGEWVENAIEDIKTFFKELPNKIIQGVGQVGNWINEIFDHYFGHKKYQTMSITGKTYDVVENSRFEYFLGSTISKIREWFDKLPEKVESGLKGVGDFFSRLFKQINNFLFGKKKVVKMQRLVTQDGEKTAKLTIKRYKTGFSKWLDDIIKEIKKIIKNIPEYIKAGIRGAGDIISSIANALFGNDKNDSKDTSKKIEDEIKKPFLGINWDSIWESIKDIGKTLFTTIGKIFTGSDDFEVNAAALSEAVASAIRWIRDKAVEAFNWVIENFPKIPEKIAEFFSNEKNGGTKDQGPVGKAISDFASAVGSFIADIPSMLTEFVTNAITGLGDIWDRIYKAVTNTGEDTSEKVQKYAEDEFGYPVSYAHNRFKHKSKWEEFVENVGKLISTAFKELPEWIAKGIDMAILGIDEAISKIGDWFKGTDLKEETEKILANVNNTTEETKEAVSNATKNVGESAKDGEKAEESGLITAIKSIAIRIGVLFTETIPGVLKEAWKDVFAVGSEVWKGLKALFTGDKSIADSEISEATFDLGEKIKKFLIEDIPKAIKDAFDFIAKLINGEVDYSDLTGEAALKEKLAMHKNILKPVEDADKEIGKETKDSSFLSGIKSIGETIKNAFIDIAPTILEGLSFVLDTLANIGMFIVNVLTGDVSIGEQVEKAYGKEKPELVSSLTKIGESIKNFFLDTLPNFIGSAMGALMANAEEWFGKLFASLTKSADKAKKDKGLDNPSGKTTEQQLTENATSILDTVKTWFDSFVVGAGIDAAKTIAIILAVVSVLNALRDILTVSDELDATARVLKWGAILIAMTALTAVVSSITNIVKSGSQEEYNKAISFLKEIGNLLLGVITIVALITGSKIFEAVHEIGELAEGAKDLKAGEKMASGFAGILTSFLKTLGLTGGAAVGSGLLASGLDMVIQSASESFMLLSSGMNDALNYLTPFIDTLVEMKDKVESAREVAVQLSSVMVAFWLALDDVYVQLFIPEEEQKTWSPSKKRGHAEDMQHFVDNFDTREKYLQILADKISVFTQFSSFMSNIGTALEALQNVDDIEARIDEVIKIFSTGKFTTLLKLMFDAVSDAMSESKLDPKEWGATKDLMDWYGAGITVALSMLSESLSIFSSSVTGVTEDNVKGFENAMNAIKTFVTALDDNEITQSSLSKSFEGNKTLSSLGYHIKTFGMHMKEFFKYATEIKGFDTEEIKKKTLNQIDGISAIGQKMAEVSKTAVYGDSEKLGKLAEILPGLGEKMGGFAIRFREAFTSKGELMSSEELASLQGMSDSISNLFKTMAEFSTGADLGSITESLWDNVSGSNGDKFIASMRKILNKYSELMKETDTGESFKEVGKSLATRFAEAIELALEEDPSMRPEITPVLKLEPAEQQLKDFFINNGVGTVDATGFGDSVKTALREAYSANAQIDTTAIAADVSAIKESLSNLASPADVSKALGGMKMVLSTGQIVGALTPSIDKEIGYRIWLLTRGNTVGS